MMIKENSRFRAVLESPLFVPAALLLIVLVVLGSFLTGGGAICSSSSGDLAHYYIYCRQFGAAQMRQGHIPLWNPHLCGGVPFAGNWQAALFYPLNWHYLFLPINFSVNLEIALHVFLTGYFTSLWAKRHSFHPIAQLLAGTMVMLGGAYYLHLFAGHLPMLDAWAWAPLVLLAIEEIAKRPTAKWALVGALALAMQILCGLPQVIYNSLIAAALYAPFLLWKSPQRGRALGILALAFCGGIALSAVQLGVGFAATADGIRQGAVPYSFAASFAFTPQNMVTLLIPGFFGDMIHAHFWNVWFLWETSAFISVTGVAMAIYAVFWGDRKRDTLLLWLFACVVMVVLALGDSTPLFRFCYLYLPGFNKFRGSARFLYEAGLFGSMLAAAGLDAAIKNAKRAVPLVVALAGIGMVCFGLGLYLKMGSGQYGDPPLWKNILLATDEHQTEIDRALPLHRFIPSEIYRDVRFFNETREFAGAQCLIASLVLLVLAGLLFVVPKQRYAVYGIALLGLLELVWFARTETVRPLQTPPTDLAFAFKLSDTLNPSVENFLATKSGDYRIADWATTTASADAAVVRGHYDIYGYEPMVRGRYAQLMKLTQNYDPDDPDAEIAFHIIHPLFGLVRCQYIFTPTSDDGVESREMKNPAPHLVLTDKYEVQEGRTAVYAAMQNDIVASGARVILETAPDPAPTPGTDSGTVNLVEQTSDSLTIDATTTRPMLLLVTDAYSIFWKATALPGSSQQAYQVLPADLALRAIPLGAGTHHIKLEYAPEGYIWGKWISLFSAGVFALLTFRVWRQAKRMLPLPEPVDAETALAGV